MRLAELLALAPAREYRRIPPATLATVATHPPATPPTVATVATVARAKVENRGTDPTALRGRLVDLCRQEGLPDRLAATLPDADLAGCDLLSEAGLRRWLHVLDENARMREGIAPPGWTQASYCRRCGPVRLWQGAPPVVLGCPWCHIRRAGGIVPRPAVACASCTHQRLRPGTSEAGMHGCAKGHGMHYARAQHVCADWRPLGSPP